MKIDDRIKIKKINDVFLAELAGLEGNIKAENEFQYGIQFDHKPENQILFVNKDFVEKIQLENETDKTTFQKIISSYHWETDPGHGWLVVPARHLTEMKVQYKISSYSYISTDGKTAYLEEDCDAYRFLQSFDNQEKVKEAAKNWKDKYKQHTFVRSLPSYSSDKIKA